MQEYSTPLETWKQKCWGSHPREGNYMIQTLLTNVIAGKNHCADLGEIR